MPRRVVADDRGRLALVTHPVEEFWALLQAFDDYPRDVAPVPALLPGTAAFAASSGLCREHGSHELPPFPYEGLMVVGHNLDSRDGYERRRTSGVSHGDVVPGPAMNTWLGLYRLLHQAGVGREEFFFTNVFVGLKEGKPTGQFSAHAAPSYRRFCAEFLRHQVMVMRPCVVLILGVHACRDVASMTTPQPWRQDSLPAPVPVTARFAGHDTTLVPAHHTSYQKRVDADAAALRVAWRGKSH